MHPAFRSWPSRRWSDAFPPFRARSGAFSRAFSRALSGVVWRSGAFSRSTGAFAPSSAGLDRSCAVRAHSPSKRSPHSKIGMSVAGRRGERRANAGAAHRACACGCRPRRRPNHSTIHYRPRRRANRSSVPCRATSLSVTLIVTDPPRRWMRRINHSRLHRSTRPRLNSDILGWRIPKAGASRCCALGPSERVSSRASWRRSG